VCNSQENPFSLILDLPSSSVASPRSTRPTSVYQNLDTIVVVKVFLKYC